MRQLFILDESCFKNQIFMVKSVGTFRNFYSESSKWEIFSPLLFKVSLTRED